MPDDFDDPRHAVEYLRGLDCRWGVCGGWAVDLFANRVTRQHADVDVAFLRSDQRAVLSHFAVRGWSLSTAHAGQLTPWKSPEQVELPIHCIWCRKENAIPAFIEILLNESAGEDFVFRRCFDVRLPLKQTFLRSKAGIPILAPEIVLLYKSKGDLTPKTAADFDHAVGALEPGQRSWLRNALDVMSPTHPWIQKL